MKKYISNLTLVSFSLTSVLLVFGLIIDPFSSYRMIELNHINKIKAAASSDERLYKVNMMSFLAPDVLILGSSREDLGIDPHDVKLGQNAYNGATVSQPYRESNLSLQYLYSTGHYPKHILLGLLFESSDVYKKLPSDFDVERLYGGKISKYKLLLNRKTIKASITTVYDNLNDSRNSIKYTVNGLRLPHYLIESLNEKGQREIFLDNERHYLFDSHYELPLCKENSLYDPVTGYSKLDEIRELIRLAYSQHADLRMLIGPSHARQWETIKVSGLWGKFEEWKQRIIEINEQEANKANLPPFPVWDFSGYTSVTTEDVPLPNDVKSRMKYYLDSSHYTPLVGKMVLKRMYGSDDNIFVPNDFGVKISPDNLSQHASFVRGQQSRWEESHPKDVSEILQLKQEVNVAKKCP